jgi:hypothetical protein
MERGRLFVRPPSTSSHKGRESIVETVAAQPFTPPDVSPAT